MRTIMVSITGLFFGVGLVVFLFHGKPVQLSEDLRENKKPAREVIGFLPYWLVSKVSSDSYKYFSTLTYFGLTLDENAKIKKFDNPGEKEPGWHLLESGKMGSIFADFSGSGKKLSLLVFCADQEDIASIVENPVVNAHNLISEITPLMSEFGFSDLNLDIEDLSDTSSESRENFVKFVTELSRQLKTNYYTLTVEISPTDMIRNRLTDVKEVAKVADKIVVMGYDYHYVGSFVTGPVGPLRGAESEAEFDVETAIKLMAEVMPKEKIVLGVPTYGYEWETLGDRPRMAIIPGTGQVASNKRVEQILEDCAECNLSWDENAKEAYLIYKNDETGTYHQIYYPSTAAMQAKVDFIKYEDLGGLADWALGYEDTTVLDPLEELF